jgi:hypothetical protein
MAIPNQQTINIGLPNESAGSDSLYTAFNKINTNFTTLFGNSSPYNNFTAGNGIGITANANTGAVTITNTGVTNVIAGANIVVSQSNGDVVISSLGGGNGGGGLSNIGLNAVSNTRIVVTNSPLVSDGVMFIDLATSGANAGSYIVPTLTVDSFGRITAIANGNAVGTVTSVGVTPGTGIQVTGSPITSNGNITVTNTGVTRLIAGGGISLSGGNGNVTVSTSVNGTVTSVGINSSTLSVTGGPITSAGTIGVNLSANVPVTGRLLLSGSEDLADAAAANLSVTASYFSTGAAETATLAAGTEGLIKTFMMVADSGDMVITVTNAGWKTSGTGTMTFDTIGDGCTLQYINSKWFCVGNNGVVFA